RAFETSIPAMISILSHPCLIGLRISKRPWRLFGFDGTTDEDPSSFTGFKALGRCGLSSVTAFGITALNGGNGKLQGAVGAIGVSALFRHVRTFPEDPITYH
ncbi:hypothetical protein, partial [Agrobacterium sp. AGB01]|uniref:hypothetical protein n=1 Tax=Agrobacterium sp. AGB01 TaxID=2769302 RepID=UPI001AEEBA75